MAQHEITAEQINIKTRENTKEFILSCENRYKLQIESAVCDICKKSGHRLVMLAGPSSSGKTTTASLIAKEAQKRSRNAVVISLDDFYLDQTRTLYFEDGTPDFETVSALDVDYIIKCLTSLVKTGECLLPRFSFLEKKREEQLVPVRIEKDDVIIVEGLHAMNPKITSHLEDSCLTKLYVSVSSRVLKEGKVLFSKRDLRFIRRMIRDYHFRNAEIDYTFNLWKGVRMGEDRYLFPFRSLSDVKIDSFHAYEPCLFKDEAKRLLDRIGKDSVYYDSANALSKKLSVFESIDRSQIPENSLLHEFIG